MKRAMAVVLLCLVAAACGKGGNSAEAEALPSGDEAIDVCRQSVETKLKAPATAEWSDELAESVSDDNDRFQVSGNVDAENGFGALIRLTWTCDARLRTDGRWAVTTELED